MFSWKTIYKELATKLLAYRDRQNELIAWLHEMKSEGIPVIKLEDENPKGRSVPLSEIDPFSFFANFNRAIKNSHRVRCLEFLKNKMGLSSPVPSDFDGIPVVNLQKAIFFPFAYDRAKHMVPTLWDLAAEVVEKEPDKVSGELFSRCLDIPQVGSAKLTIGMFWMRPDQYLALDSLIKEYAKGFGVHVGKIKSYETYREAVAHIESTLGGDYPHVSRDAYLFANKVPVSADALDVGFKQLLESQAEKNSLTVDQVVQQLTVPPDGGVKENEITNRLRMMPRLAAVLAKKPLDLDALKDACKKFWVLANGTDSIRRNAFLSSDVAIQAIENLLDDVGEVDELARIDNFVETATEHGYASPDKPDAAGAAQFASALLSAVYPDRFADFRKTAGTNSSPWSRNRKNGFVRAAHTDGS